MNEKFHFFIGKPTLAAFVAPFIEKLGNVPLNEADTLVAIGGDGSLIDAFHAARDGQRVFGIVPPGTRSIGFWSNRGIETPQRLLSALGAAEEFAIHPLKAEITLQDGSKQTIRGYNEIAPGEYGSEAMEAELTLHDANLSIGPAWVKGGGLIVASPYGSTAMNVLYGGGIVDLRVPSLIVTGKGLRGPKGPFGSAVLPDDVCVELKFNELEKRPVRIQHDNRKTVSDLKNPFDTVKIEKDADRTLRLLVMQQPISRALEHLM